MHMVQSTQPIVERTLPRWHVDHQKSYDRATVDIRGRFQHDNLTLGKEGSTP